MKPFEIAMAVRNRPAGESVGAFALRTMAGERMSDFLAGLNLCIGWERAVEELASLVEMLRPATAKKPEATITALITEKRRLGYDAPFEALLARRWRCPHCKQYATIEKVELQLGDPESLPRCMTCGDEGIAPVDTEVQLDVHDGGKSGLRPI